MKNGFEISGGWSRRPCGAARASLLFLLLFVSGGLFAENETLFGRSVGYHLDGPGYQVQKVANNGFEILVVKFPEVESRLLHAMVVPQFAVVAEKVPGGTSTIDYLQYKLGQIQSMEGFNNHPAHDDLLSCGLSEAISLYFEYTDPRGALHSSYNVAKVQGNVAFWVTFDCTSDLYPDQRGSLQNLLLSLRIED